ncbi:MAG: hypothetical protein IJW24_04310 [Clostridia bacterium]|nr:hypothetical protein [Clostridia bacterium]
MAIRFCPKCMNIIKKKDTECSSCGMLVSEMDFSGNPKIIPKIEDKLDDEVIVKDEKTGKEKKLSRREKRKLAEAQEIDFEKAFSDEDDGVEESVESESIDADGQAETQDGQAKPKRHKHKPKKKTKSDAPEFSVDESGKFDIDTKDVTFFEQQEEYSVKKARGEIKQEKLKWWEIYKWADRLLARRKIMKEVNKAARVKPDFISKGKLMILALLFGWLGLHNFYAGNKKRGWAVIIMWAIIIPVIMIDVLYNIMGVFVGGGLGFVVLSMWVFDFAAICFNKYKYDITKMQFIKKLNTETRAKLGKKYIDIK